MIPWRDATMTVENIDVAERSPGVIATEIDTGSAARGRARLYFLIKAEAVVHSRQDDYYLFFARYRPSMLFSVACTFNEHDDFLSFSSPSLSRRYKSSILSMRTVCSRLGAKKYRKNVIDFRNKKPICRRLSRYRRVINPETTTAFCETSLLSILTRVSSLIYIEKFYVDNSMNRQEI